MTQDTRCGAVAAGVVREQRGASQADLAPGVPGDLQRQPKMGVDVVGPAEHERGNGGGTGGRKHLARAGIAGWGCARGGRMLAGR